MKTKENISLDADKWDAYTIIDFTAAFLLVVISMVSADIPRQKIEIVRKAAPYVARGWTPSGQQLKLPLQTSTPAASYGPPAESTTTEEPTTTEKVSENLEQKAKPEKLELEEPQKGQYYVVLPQGQNFVYTIPRTAALFTLAKDDLVAATPARLQAVPITSAVASSVYTPFSASYIQIIQ